MDPLTSSTDEVVVRELGRPGGRASVLLVRNRGELIVKKVFTPGNERFLEREVLARTTLGQVLEEVPPLLESSPRHVTSRYYEPRFQYDRRGLRLFPIDLAVQVVDFLEKLYQQGFALLDAHPENVLVDAHGQLRVFDYEFLAPYGEARPSSFETSWDVAGPPADFVGDRPAGGCPTWERHWRPYVGLTLHELRHDRRVVQHWKRARHWLFRFLPRRLDERLPPGMLKAKWFIGRLMRKAFRGTAGRA